MCRCVPYQVLWPKLNYIRLNNRTSTTLKNIAPVYFISYIASGDFCRLLITFATILSPDQDRQNINPDISKLFDTGFDTLIVFLKEYFEEVNFDDNKSIKKYHQSVKWFESRSGPMLCQS